MVSVREFARQVGRDQALILRLLKRGVLPQNEDGTIPLADGLAAFEAYDAAPKNKGGRPKKNEKKEDVNKKEKPSVTPQPPPIVSSTQRKAAISMNAAINKVKLADAAYKAKIRKQEYEVKSGELLRRDEVVAEMQWLAEQLKAKLLAIPPRISAICEGRPAREIEEIIENAINSVLKELQKCKYTPLKE